MNRRWISAIFWSLVFAAAVFFSNQYIFPDQQVQRFGKILDIDSVRGVFKQPHLSKKERIQAEEKGVVENPTATPPGPGFEHILMLLRDDRLCEFVQSKSDRLALTRALVEYSQSPLLGQLLGPNGPLSGFPNFDSSSVVGNFYNALLYAGLIDGVKLPPLDFLYAEKLFRDSEMQDPDNGAIYLFHSYAAFKAGQPMKDQHDLLLKAIQASRFETFFTTVKDEIKLNSRVSPTLWMATLEVLSSVPIPSYPPPVFIKKLLERDPPEVHAQAVNMGLLMVDQQHAAFIERKIGSSIVGDAWGHAYPKRPKPKLVDRPAQTQSKRQIRDFAIATRALNARPCERRFMDDYYLKHRDEPFDF